MSGRSSLIALVLLAGACTAELPEEGVGSAVDTVCCGATCCLIDGTCRTTGETNPDNMCQVCDPTRTQTAWTTTPGCTPVADASVPPPPDASPRDAAPTGDGGSVPLADAGGPVDDGGMRPAVDAGDPGLDAGMGTPDSGTGTDAGSGSPDSGGGGADAGGGGADAGGGGGGGGCAVTPGGTPAPWIALTGLLVLAAVLRRRRRR